jgi:hypothetical protein
MKSDYKIKSCEACSRQDIAPKFTVITDCTGTDMLVCINCYKLHVGMGFFPHDAKQQIEKKFMKRILEVEHAGDCGQLHTVLFDLEHVTIFSLGEQPKGKTSIHWMGPDKEAATTVVSGKLRDIAQKVWGNYEGV